MLRVTATPPVSRTVPGTIAAAIGALVVTAIDAVLLVFALGSVAALLAHPRALALLAIWGVGALTLALVRPVRTNDPAQTRKEPAWVLPSLFVVPMFAAPLSALGERFGFLPWLAFPAIEWAGVAMAAAGYALRIAAMTRLGSRFSPLVSIQSSHELETAGVYSRIRHPGYAGSWLACTGAVLAFGSAIAWPLLVLFLAALLNRIAREETLLAEQFGDAFSRYRARTGALWPRLSGVAPRG